MTTSAPPAPSRSRVLPPLPTLPPVPAWQLGLGVGFGLLAALSGSPFLAVLLAFGVPYALVTSVRTKVLGYFLLLPLAGGLGYLFPATGVKVLPTVMAVALAAHLVLLLVTNRLRIPVRQPLVLLAMFFALLVVVQAMTPLAQQTGVGIAGARSYLEPFILFVAGFVFWEDRRAPRLFFQLMVFTALIVGVYMLRQLLFGFSPAEVAFQEERLHFKTLGEQRLFSTLTGPAVYAFVTVMFALTCLAARVAVATPRRVTVAVGVISAVGIVSCGTRIATIGAVPAIAMMIALVGTTPGGRRFARRAAAVGVAVAIVVAAIVAVTPVQDRRLTPEAGNPISAAITKLALLKAGGEDEDVESRSERLGLFLDYMRRHPWGAATGAVRAVPEARDTGLRQAATLKVEPELPPLLRGEPWIFQGDFYYFSVGVELGVIGLLLYLMILFGGMLFALGARARETDLTRRMVLSVSATVLAYVIIHNLTNEAFRAPEVSSYVWFLLAAPAVFVMQRRAGTAPPDVPVKLMPRRGA